MMHLRRNLHHLVPKRRTASTRLEPLEIPLVSTEPVKEKRSTFVGHAARVSTIDEATLALQRVLALKRVSKASHNIVAYRISSSPSSTSHPRPSARGSKETVATEGSEDDGEPPAGKNLLTLLQKLDLTNVVVVVTRWYGGVHMGPDRFRVINSVAKEALDLAGLVKHKERQKP
ncbi:hypothetical protein JCM10212_002018 [Sporobolomyces blumeae]